MASGMIKIAGLWLREGQKGKFFAGSPGSGASVMVLKNRYKQPNDNKPDYELYVVENKPKPTQAQKAVPNRAPQAQEAPVAEDEIPF